MNKTKKELVELIRQMILDNNEMSGRLDKANMGLDKKVDALKRMDEERYESKRLLVKCKEEKAQLHEAYDNLKKEFLALQEKEKNRTQQLDMMADDRGRLKGELEILQKRLKENEQRQQINYDLFKSFIDSDAQNILLIDASYAIKYINATAMRYLGLNGDDEVVNQRIFNFTEYADALRLKEKIDRAFLDGEKEKVKKIRFQTPGGNARKLKIKMQRVRFQDRPSVKMIIKE